MVELSCKTVAKRIAHTLRSLNRRADAEPVKLIHHQPAARVGATRESTTVAVGELAEHGQTELRRSKITEVTVERTRGIYGGPCLAIERRAACGRSSAGEGPVCSSPRPSGPIGRTI